MVQRAVVRDYRQLEVGQHEELSPFHRWRPVPPARRHGDRVQPFGFPATRGVLRVLAFITDGHGSRRILEHLGASARRATQDRAPPPAAAAVPVSP